MKKYPIQKHYGMYEVIPPRVIHEFFEGGKPLYKYRMLNIQTEFIYFPVTCSKRLEVGHFYYGYIKEDGSFWSFIKKPNPNA